MIGMLNMFIRAVVSELRSQADAADLPGAALQGTGDILRGIAGAIESAAKRTLLT